MSGKPFGAPSIRTADGPAIWPAVSTCSDPSRHSPPRPHRLDHTASTTPPERRTMNNAINQPQTILVLGGNSDIARAIVANCRRRRSRPSYSHAATLPPPIPLASPTTSRSATVTFDATDHAAHAPMIEAVAAEHGDLDVVIQAFGQLGLDARRRSGRGCPTGNGQLRRCRQFGLGCCRATPQAGSRDARRAFERRGRPDPCLELRVRLDEGRPGRIRHRPRSFTARQRRERHDRPAGLRSLVDDRGDGRGPVHDRCVGRGRSGRQRAQEGFERRVGARQAPWRVRLC